MHQALNDDLPAAVDVFRFFAGAVRTQQGQLAGEYVPGHTSMIRRDPIGVVASIALELSADDGGVEDCAGVGGGQYRGV